MGTINTIREALSLLYTVDTSSLSDEECRKVVTCRSKIKASIGALEAAMREPVAYLHDDGYWTPAKTETGRQLSERLMFAGSPKIEVFTRPAPQPEAQPDPAKLAALGWQVVECPVCGELAQGFPKSEAQQCDDCGDAVPKGKCYCKSGCVHEVGYEAAQQPAQHAQVEAVPLLTDEEIDDIAWPHQNTKDGFQWLAFARAIEAAVHRKIKGEVPQKSLESECIHKVLMTDFCTHCAAAPKKGADHE